MTGVGIQPPGNVYGNCERSDDDLSDITDSDFEGSDDDDDYDDDDDNNHNNFDYHATEDNRMRVAERFDHLFDSLIKGPRIFATYLDSLPATECPLNDTQPSSPTCSQADSAISDAQTEIKVDPKHFRSHRKQLLALRC